MLSVLTSRDLEGLARASRHRYGCDHFGPPFRDSDFLPGWVSAALVARPGPPGGVDSLAAPPELISRWVRISEVADKRVAGMVMHFQEPPSGYDVDYMPTVWLFAKMNGVYTEQIRVRWQPDWLPPLMGDEWLHWYFGDRTAVQPRIPAYFYDVGFADPNPPARPDGPRISNPYSGPSRWAGPSAVLKAVIGALDGLIVGDPTTYCSPSMHKSHPRAALMVDEDDDFYVRIFENRCCPEVYVASFPSRRRVHSLRAMAAAVLLDKSHSGVCQPVGDEEAYPRYLRPSGPWRPPWSVRLRPCTALDFPATYYVSWRALQLNRYL